MNKTYRIIVTLIVSAIISGVIIYNLNYKDYDKCSSGITVIGGFSIDDSYKACGENYRFYNRDNMNIIVHRELKTIDEDGNEDVNITDSFNLKSNESFKLNPENNVRYFITSDDNQLINVSVEITNK